MVAQLVPTGTLRIGLNMLNGLLITSTAPDGEPDGVAPDMGRAIAEQLGVGLSLVQFASPGELADAAADNLWDIGFIGAEPSRAETIDFTAAYVEIEATYLVPQVSPFITVEDVDSVGTRIAISGRSAYDLYLTRALKHAKLIRSKGITGAVEIFTNEPLDALAGLRPALVEKAKLLPNTRILDGKFTAVQQAIGIQKGKEAPARFLSEFVEKSKASGLVATLIKRHGVVGRLSVGQPALSV